MIMRIWRAREKRSEAGAYRRHLQGSVFPQLTSLSGFMGASLLERDDGRGAEIMVLTRWESMEAVRAFAGAEPEKAVVEPQARAVLESFGDTVTHHEIVVELARPGLAAGGPGSA